MSISKNIALEIVKYGNLTALNYYYYHRHLSISLISVCVYIALLSMLFCCIWTRIAVWIIIITPLFSEYTAIHESPFMLQVVFYINRKVSIESNDACCVN